MDYLSALRYEKLWFVGILAAIFLAGATIIRMLPDIYTAKSEILLQRDSTMTTENSGLSVSTAEQDLSFRANEIIKTAMTNENIAVILNKYNLVEEDQTKPSVIRSLVSRASALLRLDRLTKDASANQKLMQAIEEFRDNTEFTFDTITVANQVNGIEADYSLGLSVEHKSRAPKLAYRIARELTRLVLGTNKSKLMREDSGRFVYLQNQYRAARGKLSRADEAVAGFKDNNALYLPGLHANAIDRYDDLEEALVQVEDDLVYLARRRNEAKADMATSSKDAFLYAADGTRILGPQEQLMLLQTEYAEKAARYNSIHPELIRLRNETEALTKHVRLLDTAGLEAELRQAHEALSTKRERYSGSHPDIIALSAEIDQLERQVDQAQAQNVPASTSTPTNPEYARLVTRLEGLRDEINSRTERREQIYMEMAAVEDQLERIPYVEQKLNILKRNRHLAKIQHNAIEENLVRIKLDKGMRSADLLDRLVLLEPPTIPVTPSAPQKRVLLAVLLVLAVSAAYFFAVLLYWYRDRICNSDDLKRLVDEPVYLIPLLR